MSQTVRCEVVHFPRRDFGALSLIEPSSCFGLLEFRKRRKRRTKRKRIVMKNEWSLRVVSLIDELVSSACWCSSDKDSCTNPSGRVDILDILTAWLSLIFHMIIGQIDHSRKTNTPCYRRRKISWSSSYTTTVGANIQHFYWQARWSAALLQLHLVY
jgi:hypothetical protein